MRSENRPVTSEPCNGDPMVMRQSKVRVYRGVWITACLLLLATFPQTHGQEAAASSGTQPANPSLPRKTAPLPQITVTAKVLKQRIDTYISKVTGGNVRSDDHPIARWRVPICPLVAGLPPEDGQVVFDRLTDVLTSTDIPLGTAGCRPNFVIVVTAEPETVLKTWWQHDFSLPGGQSGFHHFIGTPRPVRIWYNTELISGDGTPITSFGVGDNSVLRGIKKIQLSPIPHIQFSGIPDLKSVIAVVDLTRVAGLDWRQVTDYIAMAGVTKINLDASLGEAPTIMSLFSTSGEARPQSLSSWDRSLIKELYLTDPVYRRQRVLIAKRMFADVSP
jgi:hypothetical protein